MTEISTSTVVKLRKISGQGMMDCKNALNQANGDIDKALEILRKKGLATLAKRAERETSEGVVISTANDDKKVTGLATLCCETDFVAKSNDFITAANAMTDYILHCSADEGIENLLETAVNGKKLRDVITEVVSKTGEKIEVGDYARYKLDSPGLISVYVHFNKKVGAMVQMDTDTEETSKSPVIAQVAADIAMHVTAAKPLALDKDGIDQKIIEQEKAIYAEQIKNKPANIIDKIVEGKLKKFFAENCLLEQPFVKDDTKTVGEIIAQAAKQCTGKATIRRFVRFGVG